MTSSEESRDRARDIIENTNHSAEESLRLNMPFTKYIYILQAQTHYLFKTHFVQPLGYNHTGTKRLILFLIFSNIFLLITFNFHGPYRLWTVFRLLRGDEPSQALKNN